MRPTSPSSPDSNPGSTSSSNGSNGELDPAASQDGSSPEPSSRNNQQHLLARLFAWFKPPAWLAPFIEALNKAVLQATQDPRLMRILRLALIGSVFVGAAVAREAMLARTRVVTREVLYSDFAALLDSRRVRAVRLEAGTGRMYFDLIPAATTTTTTTAAAAAAPAAQAPAAPAAAVTAAASQAAASAGEHSVSSTQQAAPEAASSAATTAEAKAVGSSGSGSSSSSSNTAVAIHRFERQYMVKLAEKSDRLLIEKILAAGCQFAVLKQSTTAMLANIVTTTLAVWIPLLPLFFLFRRIVEDRTGSGRKKRKDSKAVSVSVTFADVAGVDAAKEELMEVVTVMRNAKAAYTKLRVKTPSGVLLHGPPGTGKTLLAKAVAGEAGIPFMSVSASEFVELYVGQGAARVRQLFAEARKAAPCVVFIDELDAVAAKRGMGYNDERDQTLNQLLTELDGFESREGVLFLAATNRRETLDPALLRPGRINRQVVVPLPDEAGRRDILSVHMRTTPMVSAEEKSRSIAALARAAQGFSGAELANVVNEATLLAARQEKEVVELADLIEGVQRTRYGVDGRSGSQPVRGFTRWLLDMAASSSDDQRKVKNAAAT